MERHLGWVMLVGLISGFAGMGCQTVPMTHLAQKQPAAAPQGGAKIQANKDLPPKQAAQVCLATAKEMEKAGMVPHAIALYEKARNHDSSLNPTISPRLAVLYDQQGNWKRALVEYQAALKLTAKKANLLNNLGYGYYCRGRLLEAEKYLRQALAEDTKHSRAWINLGLTLGAQEKYAECLEAFAQCNTVSEAQAQCNLGFILAAQGKRDKAQEAYRKALILEPDLPMARAALVKLKESATDKPDPLPTLSSDRQKLSSQARVASIQQEKGNKQGKPTTSQSLPIAVTGKSPPEPAGTARSQIAPSGTTTPEGGEVELHCKEKAEPREESTSTGTVYIPEPLPHFEE